MAVGKVGDVNIIADAGAVGGRIIIAEQGQWRSVAGCRLHRQRNQMRFGFMELANLPVGVRARSVEISKRRGPKTMRRGKILDHPFGGPFGLAVGVDRSFRVSAIGTLSGVVFAAVLEKTPFDT